MRTRRRRLGALLLLVLVAGCGGRPPGARGDDTRDDPERWYSRHNPAVIEYLAALGPDDVGSRLDGVELEDEKRRPLEDDVYLGRAEGLPEGVELHLVEHDDEVVAWLWVETPAEPFPLPECDPGRPGFRARQLSGDIYTWRAARPGDGVLRSACPPDAWLEALPEPPG